MRPRHRRSCPLRRLPLGPWIGEGSAETPRPDCWPGPSGRATLAIGLGTVMAALRHGGPVRGWVEAGGLADAGDALVTVTSFPALPRRGRWGVLVAATSGVISARLCAPSIDAT